MGIKKGIQLYEENNHGKEENEDGHGPWMLVARKKGKTLMRKTVAEGKRGQILVNKGRKTEDVTKTGLMSQSQRLAVPSTASGSKEFPSSNEKQFSRGTNGQMDTTQQDGYLIPMKVDQAHEEISNEEAQVTIDPLDGGTHGVKDPAKSTQFSKPHIPKLKSIKNSALSHSQPLIS